MCIARGIGARTHRGRWAPGIAHRSSGRAARHWRTTQAAEQACRAVTQPAVQFAPRRRPAGRRGGAYPAQRRHARIAFEGSRDGPPVEHVDEADGRLRRPPLIASVSLRRVALMQFRGSERQKKNTEGKGQKSLFWLLTRQSSRVSKNGQNHHKIVARFSALVKLS
jgi:hypothetical protein